jgi:uncharacterized protein YbaR (Trm112 family)
VLIVLTDVLTCPRCGPDFGLIVLADRLESRRVLDGRLGCPNCREAYRIHDGVADLRVPLAAGEGQAEAVTGAAGVAGAAPTHASAEGESAADQEAAFRLAALLGLTGGPGLVLLIGEPARHAAAVAGLAEEVTVAAVAREVGALQDAAAVSRVRAGDRLPFRSRSARGVGVGRDARVALDEALRVVAPGGRLMVEEAPPGGRERLHEAGFEVLLEQDGIVVAMRGRVG